MKIKFSCCLIFCTKKLPVVVVKNWKRFSMNEVLLIYKINIMNRFFIVVKACFKNGFAVAAEIR